jgi:hypothetical protein
MSFNKNILIRSSEDVRKQRAIFNQELSVSQLQTETKIYLKDQVELILSQFERQLEVDTVKKLVAKRNLDGEGFSVEIVVRGGSPGLLDRIRGIFSSEN